MKKNEVENNNFQESGIPRRRALGKGLEELFSTEVLDFDSLEEKIDTLVATCASSSGTEVCLSVQAVNKTATNTKIHNCFIFYPTWLKIQ